MEREIPHIKKDLRRVQKTHGRSSAAIRGAVYGLFLGTTWFITKSPEVTIGASTVILTGEGLNIGRLGQRTKWLKKELIEAEKVK